MSALDVAARSKSFGRQAVLNRVDLAVADGASTAVLGPSGCGKTTLLRVIAGFEHADSGTITIGDTVVDDSAGRPDPPARRTSATSPTKEGCFPI